MRHHVERAMPFAPAVVWDAIADLRHFAIDDPFHDDLRFLGEQRIGAGTRFRLHHSYLPIFPFPPDEVVATVSRWEPSRGLTLDEVNPRAWRSHVQDFVVEPHSEGSQVVHEVTHWFPASAAPMAPWVRWRVGARMTRKLEQLEAACAAGSWEPEISSRVWASAPPR